MLFLLMSCAFNNESGDPIGACMNIKSFLGDPIGVMHEYKTTYDLIISLLISII